ncbi:AIPR family protein, partial [Mycobacterium kansasii]
DDVQVVNGLQTSHTVFEVLQGAAEDHPALDRSVLVRILVTDDASTRDRVIRATNRQTSVPAASLRATDEIQRDIEAFFHPHGWFYDRRK